ncbi:tetratricopeptide repeat protein [Armatimonas rosea]|uniref:Cytochrome c-type biogenesis protein CcmH/NrfG n=1 Tax=Armatimonas rosea TaxID=685828 RepID=A0A7W9SQ81_ARMRO|nr:tetratricopeptide repeat protein [Armatimonas rosea]MBB6050183.1 cytochrome c-type biogenesis protein CcmH/NrfG [Armatimonas rosea]
MSSPSPHASSKATSRQRLRWLGVALVLATLGLGSRSLVQAYHATWLRESYLDDLELYTRRAPTDGPALALLGGRLAEVNRFGEAADALGKAIQTGMRDELLWRTWAACLTTSNQRPAARSVLEEARKGGADKPEVVEEALKRAEALPKGASDIEVAKALCPNGPSEVSQRYSLGSYLNSYFDGQARRDRAHSGFIYRERLAHANPDSLEAQLLWAEALVRNGRYRDAEQAAQKALTLAPDSLEAQLASADVLLAGGAGVKAALAYKKILAQRKDWLPAVVGLGRAATLLKLHRLALENLEKASKQDPKNVEVWIALGKAYFYQGLRYDLSLAAYQKAAQLAPERTDFFTPMADALRANYKPAESEALLRRRLAAAPRDAQAHYMLGYHLTTQQSSPARVAEAEQHLRLSLQLEPDAISAKQALAQILLDKNDPKQAADAGILLNEVLQARPRDISALRLMALAYRKIGKPDKAKEIQEVATEVSRIDDEVRRLVEQELAHPADIAIHEKLALLYQQTGELEKAKQQMGMIQMLKTHPEQAARGLQALMDATMRETADTPKKP